MKTGYQILLLVSLLILTLLPSSLLGAKYKPSRVKNYKKIKAPFSPPSITFAVVWPILYVLTSVAVWLVLRRADQMVGGHPNQLPFLIGTILLFVFQLALNFAWIPAFSKGKYMDSLWILLGLLLLGLLLLVLLLKTSTVAALLWSPYLIWLLFALQLNISVVVNKHAQDALLEEGQQKLEDLKDDPVGTVKNLLRG